MNAYPTPYADVNQMVHMLVTDIRAVLGESITGIYLDGSLAYGDFDEASDIDFLVVTAERVSEAQFAVLHDMHARLNAGPSQWATQLEGSYLSRIAVRRYDPADAYHPNIERGSGQQLKWAQHDAGWMTHRYVLRERGIVIDGPPARTLIDPVSPDDLRSAMRGVLGGWGTQLLAEPVWLNSAGYQPYAVLSLCRILYTLHRGTIASKQAAAQWAKPVLGQPWEGLIERAWLARQRPGTAPMPEDVKMTQDLIRLVIKRSRGESRPVTA